MMNHPFYQQQDQLLTRRATEPVTLAPTASMIDPNLENHRIQQHPNLTTGYGQIQMQISGNVSMPHPQNNGPSTDFNRTLSSSAERTLPSRQVDESTIDDAYARYILYCNPTIPLDVDTTELRKGFRAPPKSDAKTFSPFTLYNLVSQLEKKEIKTWTELVLKLGVEPPDTSKNQSTQKVQQYAVRLKRWLHAFHIGAFFHYLQNKPSSYLTNRPMTEDSLVERDGIPPEEDLALRALLPEWRPKRGRRKADDIEGGSEANIAPKKVHTRSSSADFTSMFEEPYSAAPSTAIPWSAQPQQNNDPWTAAQVALAPKTPSTGQASTPNQLNSQNVGQQMRWRFTNNETPSSPYPQSAITPRHSFQSSPPFDEPKSAHPSTTSKSPSRARRRHGPAVSSAWPSTTSTASGKLRGRPPSNRSVQDGPFSTFPANPNAKDPPPPTISVGTPIIQASPSPSREPTPATTQQQQHQQHSINYIQAQTPTTTTTTTTPAAPETNHNHNHNQNNTHTPPFPTRKPSKSKLQLQVPDHPGGPVRLATPPRVLINGTENNHTNTRPHPQLNSHPHMQHERRSSADFFNQVDDDDDDGGSELGEDGGFVGGGGRGGGGGGNGVGGGNGGGEGDGEGGEGGGVDWKKRALYLKRKLGEKEEELKALKRRVLDAVM